ncbi:MAG TPA: hypothetical protein VFQ61_19705, partial [Polyangiaceae bacterium]|nr:hypothetical protein [Polyangiaceae bacterium]
MTANSRASKTSGFHIELCGAERERAAIRAFREDICRTIRLEVGGPAAEPLDYGSYLFLFAEGETQPAGMVEFFFYDQAFAAFSDAVYSQAADLGTYGSLADLVHLRSVILEVGIRHTRVFVYLMAATVLVTQRLGATHLTAGTGIHNDAILALHRRAGMTPLGRYVVDGAPQQLSLLALAPLLQRAKGLLGRGGITVNDSAAFE